jgi:hypothetical protein
VLVLTHHAPTARDTSNPCFADSSIRTAFSTPLEYMMDYRGDSDCSAIHTWISGTASQSIEAASHSITQHHIAPRQHHTAPWQHVLFSWRVNIAMVHEALFLFSGHTHWSTDQYLNGVHVVSNQYGHNLLSSSSPPICTHSASPLDVTPL